MNNWEGRKKALDSDCSLLIVYKYEFLIANICSATFFSRYTWKRCAAEIISCARNICLLYNNNNNWIQAPTKWLETLAVSDRVDQLACTICSVSIDKQMKKRSSVVVFAVVSESMWKKIQCYLHFDDAIKNLMATQRNEQCKEWFFI